MALPGGPVVYPPPRRRLPRVSHRGRLQAQTSRGANQAQQRGLSPSPGVCKDEQAERGGKRRHMTKGQRAMIAEKKIFLKKKKKKKKKISGQRKTSQPSQIVFRKPRFMLNPSLRSLNSNQVSAKLISPMIKQNAGSNSPHFVALKTKPPSTRQEQEKYEYHRLQKPPLLSQRETMPRLDSPIACPPQAANEPRAGETKQTPPPDSPKTPQREALETEGKQTGQAGKQAELLMPLIPSEGSIAKNTLLSVSQSSESESIRPGCFWPALLTRARSLSGTFRVRAPTRKCGSPAMNNHKAIETCMPIPSRSPADEKFLSSFRHRAPAVRIVGKIRHSRAALLQLALSLPSR